MNSDAFYIGQGDRVSSILRTLTTGTGGTAIDLTSATGVEFQMADEAGNLVASGACTIVTAASGIVRYDWAAGDTDTAGRFLASFIITYTGGLKQTVPNHNNIVVLIKEAFVAP